MLFQKKKGGERNAIADNLREGETRGNAELASAWALSGRRRLPYWRRAAAVRLAAARESRSGAAWSRARRGWLGAWLCAQLVAGSSFSSSSGRGGHARRWRLLHSAEAGQAKLGSSGEEGRRCCCCCSLFPVCRRLPSCLGGDGKRAAGSGSRRSACERPESSSPLTRMLGGDAWRQGGRDLPESAEAAGRALLRRDGGERPLPRVQLLPAGQRQTPAHRLRHNSFRRQLNLSNPDFNIQQIQKQEQLTGIGRIKPELYKQRSVDTDDGRRNNSKSCGKLNFIVKYDCDLEQLIVKIHKAVNLPAKDFSGTSDPYVKIYLLPDRKTKHQTKVHRKTLNPVFDEVFLFPVPYNDLSTRKLHFSVYDFDRFSRHDLIGQVIVDNFLELSDFPRECNLWKDIEYVTNDKVDLGELMFSLCYLPTAGRLTITIIKARNLKAMDITGASDPYVKVSLMCEGRRLKKRKTSTKRNTLNPVYNEAIVFDVPPENIDQINLFIAVMDYDRVGHNEVIGVCQVGNDAESLGRDHWNEMLSYPRKPIAHWHLLAEILQLLRAGSKSLMATQWVGQGTAAGSKPGSCNSLKGPPSP
uniref:Synaptotagmin 9 n=1 Tax=Podarcis muralis TaxID=64176 RepID=A0A670HQV9_PODMU